MADSRWSMVITVRFICTPTVLSAPSLSRLCQQKDVENKKEPRQPSWQYNKQPIKEIKWTKIENDSKK